MLTSWNLHLLRVVIDDGEPEIHVSDAFRWFAISFWTETHLSRSTDRTKTAIPIANNYCRVNAEVVYISHGPEQAACIIDCGITAISELGGILGIPLPPGCQVGNYISGELRLCLPLCTVVHPLDLSNRWRVQRMTANLASFSDYPGDTGGFAYQDIQGTDSVKAPSYILHCSVEK